MTCSRSNQMTQCPGCRSTSISTSYTDTILQVPIASTVRYRETINICRDCSLTGDFRHVNDNKINKAIAKARQTALLKIIDLFTQKRCPLAYIERMLGLPQGQIINWAENRCSAEALALLHIVSSSPKLPQLINRGSEHHTTID